MFKRVGSSLGTSIVLAKEQRRILRNGLEILLRFVSVKNTRGKHGTGAAQFQEESQQIRLPLVSSESKRSFRFINAAFQPS